MIRTWNLLLLTGLALSFAANADSFYIAPFLQNITQDGATIIYQTNEKGVGEVEYGLDEKYGQKATGAPDEMIRKVRITGLKPDTAYSYRVKAGSEEKKNTFKTAPAASADREVTFGVFGDTRRWEDTVEKTKFIDHIKQWNAEFYIINGDLVVKGHDYSLWKPHFDRFEELGASHMIVTARGNHEGSMITDQDNDWFAKYHDIPGGEPYANFTWGNVHVVSLSWEQVSVPAMAGTTAKWLDEHLAGIKSPYTFVTQHFPVYCTGYAGPKDDRKQPGEDTMSLFRRVMDKHHVDANMSGHTHIYERHYPLRDDKRNDREGVHYVVNGGDINANYPEWWTAYSDNGSGMTKPTYTIFQCKKDRMDIRTFAWSKDRNQFEEIDRDIQWKDKSVPKATLDSLKTASGDALPETIEQLGAMLYDPAIPALAEFLKPDKDAALRKKAAWAISMIGTKESVMTLKPYLDDSDADVRYQAARAFEVALPDALAKEAAKRATDNNQDPRVRVKLIGGLQLHGPAGLTKETVLAILASDAPAEVRQRASYALVRVSDKADVPGILKSFADEKDEYVTTRLAFTLNKLTEFPLDLNAIAKSKPGERKEFIEKWQNAPAKAAAAK